jgi:cytosine/adenosine deaminase-related metal-dependent hydrolase
MGSHELVLRGGRAIDPETGLDAVCDVAIDGGKITAVTPEHLEATVTIDATGLVVAPGFIDLHSHAQTLAGRRLQACDGVTTALDLEAGRGPTAQAYAEDAGEGSPINYGFSASWAAARMRVVGGLEPMAGSDGTLRLLGDERWQGPATREQLALILGTLQSDLDSGAIGIGLLMGYAPGVDPEEYLAVARLAAEAVVPTFTHCRDLVELSPDTLIDGAEELVRAAGTTGAHMHHCHINSTSVRHIDRVLSLVDHCRAEGGRVTVEAYPYGSGATAIGAAFLSPDRLAQRGLTPSSLTYLATGERLADEARLLELREVDPGGVVILDFLDESRPADNELLRRSLAFDGAIVASDAMPLVSTSPDVPDPEQWPPPPGMITHPRTAGCFSRAIRLWREEGKALTDALARCTLAPAQVLEESTPAMRAKGRVQEGADADLVVFDYEEITDGATYADSVRRSRGIRHVVVAGTFVVRDNSLVPGARPGRPIHARPA